VGLRRRERRAHQRGLAAVGIAGALAAAFTTAAPAHAALHDRGGGLIYDDVLNITWLQNAGYGGLQWAPPPVPDALAWVEALTYYDSVRDVTWSDWRLPTALNPDGSGPDVGFSVTDSEMGHMFYNNLGGMADKLLSESDDPDLALFPDLRFDLYWSGTEADSTYAWAFNFGYGDQRVVNKGVVLWVWPVRDGDVAVPEPASLVLVGSVVGGLISLRRGLAGNSEPAASRGVPRAWGADVGGQRTRSEAHRADAEARGAVPVPR